jgi:Mor family transcriptional regulator
MSDTTERDDLLTRLIHRLLELQPSLSEDIAVSLEYQLRGEFAGEEARIYKTPLRKKMEEDIKRRFNGRNALALAHEYGISRATVYRIAGK